jgi:hypothetical protein
MLSCHGIEDFGPVYKSKPNATEGVAQSWESTTVLLGSERMAALLAWPMLSAPKSVDQDANTQQRGGNAHTMQPIACTILQMHQNLESRYA